MTGLLHLCLQLLVALRLTTAAVAAAESRADCRSSCGSVAIEYPFGIGATCARPGFEVICDGGGTPVLNGTTQVPIDHLSIATAEARVMLPVAWECYNASDGTVLNDDWSSGDVQFNRDGVYRVSSTHNQVVVVGCNAVGYTRSQWDQGNQYSYAVATGCMVYCNSSASVVDGACAGAGCCRVDIPPGITDNSMSFRSCNHKNMMDFSPYDYAFLVDRDNYTFRTADLKMDRNRTMPVWLDWAIRDEPTCDDAKKAQGYACVSSNSDCHNSINGPGYILTIEQGIQELRRSGGTHCLQTTFGRRRNPNLNVDFFVVGSFRYCPLLGAWLLPSGSFCLTLESSLHDSIVGIRSLIYTCKTPYKCNSKLEEIQMNTRRTKMNKHGFYHQCITHATRFEVRRWSLCRMNRFYGSEGCYEVVHGNVVVGPIYRVGFLSG